MTDQIIVLLHCIFLFWLQAAYTMQTSNFKPRPRDGTFDEAHSSDPRRRVRYENTYRTEPKALFPVVKVRKIVKDILSTLNTHKYEPTISSTQSKLLSQRILDEVRLLNIPRYKLVCFVSIGSKARHGLRMASRCLWNPEHDTFVSETLEKHNFFAVATLYACYYEWSMNYLVVLILSFVNAVVDPDESAVTTTNAIANRAWLCEDVFTLK